MSTTRSAPSLRTRNRSVSFSLLRPAACALLALSCAAASPAQSRPGFVGKRIPLPAPSMGWSGLDVLPGGALVAFDGQRVVEIDPGTGKLGSTLATLPSAAFASDVVVGPSGTSLFYCESSNGTIYQLDLATKQSRVVTTLGGCFQLGFHPHEGERYLYVSALPGFVGDAKIFRVDIWSSKATLLASAPGYSGPFRFDASGRLYFAPAPKSTSPKQAQVLRWDAAQVRSAIAGTPLDEKSAEVFASELDNVFDFVVDGEGTIYGSDASFGASTLFELAAAGGKGAHAGLFDVQGLTFASVLYVPGDGPFERYGSEGRLFALASDFAKTHELIELRPARPTLTASPATQVAPTTPLQFDLAGAPAQSAALWLLGPGLVPERPLLPLGVRGLEYPSFAVVLTGPFLALPSLTDGQGRARLVFPAPGPKGLRFTVQCLCGPVAPLPGGEAASPLVTSAAVRMHVR